VFSAVSESRKLGDGEPFWVLAGNRHRGVSRPDNSESNSAPRSRASAKCYPGAAQETYGLGADWGQLVKNNVLTFRNERALSFQLDSAKQNTLIAAAECKAKFGFAPDYVG
jgi:hypothetical protein